MSSEMSHEHEGDLICEECGDETDIDYARGILHDAGIDCDEVLCEGCADERLQTCRSQELDDMERGIVSCEDEAAGYWEAIGDARADRLAY